VWDFVARTGPSNYVIPILTHGVSIPLGKRWYFSIAIRFYDCQPNGLRRINLGPKSKLGLITKTDVRAGGSRRATTHLPVHIYMMCWLCVILMSCYHNVPFITRRRRGFLSCCASFNLPQFRGAC